MSDETDEERILEIMREKGCSRHEAENRLRSSHVAVSLLAPDLFKPIPLLQQPQEIPQVEESEEETEEFQESEPEIDPFFEQKQSQMEQKQRILDELEQQLNEQNEFSDYLAVPEWREALRDYIHAIEFVIKGYGNYFIQVVKIGENGKKLHFEIEYYDKDGKKIEPVNPVVAQQSVEGK
jgi:hypothetical protein